MLRSPEGFLAQNEMNDPAAIKAGKVNFRNIEIELSNHYPTKTDSYSYNSWPRIHFRLKPTLPGGPCQ